MARANQTDEAKSSAASTPRALVPQEAVENGIYTDLRTLMRFREISQNLEIFRHQAAKSMLLGNVRSRFRGRGMEFEEARPYQPGDDIRSIDWRVSARTGVTHTKVYAEERERPVHLILDQRSSMFFGSSRRFKSVLSAELAACLAWAAMGASDRIGGQIFGDTEEVDVRARRTQHAVLRFLTHIVEFNHALPGVVSDEARPTRSLSMILEECRRLTRPGTAVFILSDFQDFDTDAARLLSGLGRHNEITLFWITDPLEYELAITGRLGVSDGSQMRSVNFSKALRARYQERRESRQTDLEEAAQRARARLVQISTENDPIAFLRRLYRS